MGEQNENLTDPIVNPAEIAAEQSVEAPAETAAEQPVEAPAETTAEQETAVLDPLEIKRQERIRKKKIRADVNGTIAGFLAYYGIFNALAAGIMMIIYLPSLISTVMEFGAGAEYMEQVMKMTADGLPYLITVPIALAVFALLVRRKVTVKEVFAGNEKMTVKDFFKIFAVFMALQFPISVIDLGFQGLAGLFGSSGSGFSELMGSLTNTDNVAMIIYVSFLGPIVEELAFRGLMQTPLRKYGRMTAILMTAIIFGGMHMNLLQTVFAIGAGLVFGYVREKYSITWAIILHVVNNGIFGSLLSFLLNQIPDIAFANAINWAWQGLFFAAGVAVVVLDRAKFKALFAELKAERGKDGKTARSAGLYVATAIAFMAIATVFGIALYFLV